MKASSARVISRMATEIIRAAVISAKVKAAIIIVTTAMETEMAQDSAREDHRGEMAARVDSVETEMVMDRTDLQDREIPRTEDRARVMVTDAASVRARVVTIEMETEMEADSAREDHRAARAVSVAIKTATTVMKAVSEDRSPRDSVPEEQEEAVDQTLCSHQS